MHSTGRRLVILTRSAITNSSYHRQQRVTSNPALLYRVYFWKAKNNGPPTGTPRLDLRVLTCRVYLSRPRLTPCRVGEVALESPPRTYSVQHEWCSRVVFSLARCVGEEARTQLQQTDL